MITVEENSARHQHVLDVLEVKHREAKAHVATCERNGWAEALSEAEAELDDWALLYDAVSDGLLARLKAEHEKYKALVAGGVL